jgi:signal transduction histidine kinase/CheY-like chemotaxis protein
MICNDPFMGRMTIEKPSTEGAGRKQDDSVDKDRPSATELAAANRSLSEINADLERRVRERTAELASANELLRVKEQTLRLAQHFGGAGTWDWEIASGRLTWWDCYGAADSLEQAPTPVTYADWIATLYPEDRGPVEERLNACVHGDQDEFVIEYRADHPQLGPRWMAGRGRCIRDASGNPVRLIGLRIDVTDRRRAEEAMRAVRDEAERANADKSRFLAAASHDLRQPVQAASLFLGMLERRNLDSETRDLVGMVASSLEGLRGMLNGLLEVARLEAGIVDPQLREFPIDDLLHRLGSEFEEQARAKRLWLQVPPAPLIVSSDPLLLELILRNLISNAIKYTERGGVTVECREQAGAALLEVTDTGRGIPKDKFVEIFEDFRQLDNPARDRARGFGLGLATVDRVARLLGYDIQIRSELGVGSVFSFRMPLGSDHGTDESARTDRAGAEPHGDLAGRSIIVVEDDPAILLALEMLLGDWGMGVHSAHSVEDVPVLLDRLRRPPDLLAVDYRLPNGTSGLDAVTIVHQRWPVPAILMTGDTAPERLTEAKRSGYRLLHKPINPDDLRRTLVECL